MLKLMMPKIPDSRILNPESRQKKGNKMHNIPGDQRLPKWMRASKVEGRGFFEVRNTIRDQRLETICSSGNCPNRNECWSAGTATFMILGETCTRNCRFCDVKTAVPDRVDWDEPLRVAESIKKLRLKHAVITSVARDDLEDGGIEFWSTTVRTIKAVNLGITIETLIPDFKRPLHQLDLLFRSKPEVISHNIETVRRISPRIRSVANYDSTLGMLRHISENGFITKSGFMVGLGETPEEVYQTMDDLIVAGVQVLTIGQYLPPSPRHARLIEYVHPVLFQEYEKTGLQKGFRFVESGPMVRSSYRAERHITIHNK